MSDRMPDRISEHMPDRMPDRMSEYMSDKLSEYIKYSANIHLETSWGLHELKYLFFSFSFSVCEWVCACVGVIHSCDIQVIVIGGI